MEIKCPICGAPMEADTCSYCGHTEKKAPDMTVNGSTVPVQMQPQQMQQTPQPVQMQPQAAFGTPPFNQTGITPGVSRKSKSVALLLCVFLGGLGAHRFYVGKIGMGIVYLCTLGLFGLGWLIDIILILSGNFQDEFGLPLRQ